jgi:hypothetical protein
MFISDSYLNRFEIRLSFVCGRCVDVGYPPLRFSHSLWRGLGRNIQGLLGPGLGLASETYVGLGLDLIFEAYYALGLGLWTGAPMDWTCLAKIGRFITRAGYWSYRFD